MKKKHLAIVLSLMITVVFASCRQLDVVGNKSITSFEKVLNKIPDKVSEDDQNAGWSLSAPDGSARFIWSKDFSNSGDYDTRMEIDSKPFIDAGLDAAKLPDGMMNGDKIIVGKDLGNDKVTYSDESTPLASYEKIVETNRESIQYHAALDHFGVSLDSGNAFEWAKEIGKNDKDIVFVLNPQVFIDAGVDPEKVEGWVFAKVETMDMKGKPLEVDKLLKPFDL